MGELLKHGIMQQAAQHFPFYCPWTVPTASASNRSPDKYITHSLVGSKPKMTSTSVRATAHVGKWRQAGRQTGSHVLPRLNCCTRHQIGNLPLSMEESNATL